MEDIKIIDLGQGKFEVYFDFLPVPVNMNKGYLDAVIKDLNPDYIHQETAK